MGLLQIKYVDAIPVVQKNETAGATDLAVGTTYKFIVPRDGQDDLAIDYTPVSGERTIEHARYHLYEQLKNEGFLIGALNSETSTNIIRIQNLDLADSRIVTFENVTTEIGDDKGNDFNTASYNPIVQAYDAGKTITISFDQITSIDCEDNIIKLYYGPGSKYIKFVLGTIDTAQIDRIRIDASTSNTPAITETAVTAGYLASEDDFYILEEQLFDAIIASESPGIHYLNYDTANISVSYHSS